MTEAEWRNGSHPARMYNVVRNLTTTRQVRLYMVACCRLKATEFFDPRISVALESAERCADDHSAEAIANAVWNELNTFARPDIPKDGFAAELARAILDIRRLLDEVWDHDTNGVCYRNPQHALVHAVYMSLRDKPREVFTGGAGNAAEYCAWMIATVALLRMGLESVAEDEDEGWETETRREIAHLLRDIFGNPFRPVAFAAEWRTATTVALAESMYAARDFGALPVLADALEEAGCDHADVLTHCRGPGPHVRGCWVVDLVLGKS